jgi:hypothetical protein
MKTIDSIQPPHPRRQTPRLRPQPTRPPATGARFTKVKDKPRRRWFYWDVLGAALSSPLLFGLALLGVWGVVALGAMGVVVLALRWSSRMSFVWALAALVYMIGLQLADNMALASVMATLAYGALAAGGLRLAFEVRAHGKVWFKKH